MSRVNPKNQEDVYSTLSDSVSLFSPCEPFDQEYDFCFILKERALTLWVL